MIEFSCSCGRSYAFKDELAGRRGKCKQCGAPIQVPEKADGKKETPSEESGRPMPWDQGATKKLSRLAEKCGRSPVYLIAASIRFFTGPGPADFRENALCVRGALGPNPIETSSFWLAAVVIGNFAIAFLPIRAVMFVAPFLFNAAAVAYLFIRLLSGREMRTIFVRRGKIASVTCSGPIVTIKLRPAPVPGVSSIRIFVSPRYREKFFREFDKIFPRLLPEDYRAAGKNRDRPHFLHGSCVLWLSLENGVCPY